MSLDNKNSGSEEAVILVKASPQIGKKHGETVCCAGVTLDRNWVRLYPVAFRTLDESQKFGRWNKVRFKWRKPKDDPRIESRRVDHQSLEIIGELKKSEREKFLTPLIVTSLDREREANKSFALLKVENPKFFYERKSDEKIKEEATRFENLGKQEDLFNTKHIIPLQPCPFLFKYKYKTDDGEREGTCQDWEIDATFFNWRRSYGEEKALQDITRVFGVEYPEKGMVLAMGTHSLYPDTWLINGIIRLDEFKQLSLF